MAVSLFITGASGFVGRHVLAQCGQIPDGIVCLSRQPQPESTVQWIQGDIREPSSYRAALTRATTVVHLAALTGKAEPATYARVNVEGTRALLAACAEQGVRRFLLVSSVAARYADQSSYPYGASKRQAEQLVEASGIPYLIVRPTVILGSASPIWQKLRQLGRQRLIPLIGGGQTRTQPIHVRDVAAALLAAARADYRGETFELGGPDAITLRELLARIHAFYHRSRALMVPIPYAPVHAVLRALEPGFSKLLPISAGQLSLFVNDSTVHSNRGVPAGLPPMMGIDEMIRACELADA